MAKHKQINAEELYNYYKNGISKAKLARMYEVNKTTVGYWINKFEQAEEDHQAHESQDESNQVAQVEE